MFNELSQAEIDALLAAPILEKEREGKQQEIFDKLEAGQIVKGTVVHSINFRNGSNEYQIKYIKELMNN